MRINNVSNYSFAGQPMVVGNMKMNKSPKESKELINEIAEYYRDFELSYKTMPYVGMAPTSLAFMPTRSMSQKKIKIGAQEADVGKVSNGAMTGAVSQEMFKREGADFVIIGHSERRTNFGETNEKVNEKLLNALKFNLRPIVCVGEDLFERSEGATDLIINTQILQAFQNVERKHVKDIVVAYEPLWAINTGKTCSPDEADRVCRNIRNTISLIFDDVTAGDDITILYGGSVKPENADAIFKYDSIDGGLIGGACLDSGKFSKIIQACIDNKCERNGQ